MSNKPAKAILFAAAAFALAACGFHPLYGTIGGGAATDAALRSIYVESIPDRVGYQLRNDLIDQFNAQSSSTGAAYRLQIELKSDEKGLALQENASITRFSYHLTAHYQLLVAGSTTVLKKGDVHSLTSYNVVQSPYATVAANKDAQDRAVEDIAERLRTEIAVYFLNTKAGKS
jgi:LPS-assembly lipoprotein